MRLISTFVYLSEIFSSIPNFFNQDFGVLEKKALNYRYDEKIKKVQIKEKRMQYLNHNKYAHLNIYRIYFPRYPNRIDK